MILIKRQRLCMMKKEKTYQLTEKKEKKSHKISKILMKILIYFLLKNLKIY